jgi:hypothetical protein
MGFFAGGGILVAACQIHLRIAKIKAETVDLKKLIPFDMS